MGMIRDLVLSDQRNKLHEETREKLSFLNNAGEKANRGIPNTLADRLDTIAELDSTGINEVTSSLTNKHTFQNNIILYLFLEIPGSLLSELSYSRSEDDLDLNASFLDSRKDFKKSHPPPDEILAPSPKRRRSNIRRSLEVII